jgi:hypothetical protein
MDNITKVSRDIKSIIIKYLNYSNIIKKISKKRKRELNAIRKDLTLKEILIKCIHLGYYGFYLELNKELHDYLHLLYKNENLSDEGVITSCEKNICFICFRDSYDYKINLYSIPDILEEVIEEVNII